MPASEVMKKYRSGKLHSGSKRGPVVRDTKQAKAIQISEARSEGHDIPKKPSRSSRSRHGRRKRSRSGRRRGYNRR